MTTTELLNYMRCMVHITQFAVFIRLVILTWPAWSSDRMQKAVWHSSWLHLLGLRYCWRVPGWLGSSRTLETLKIKKQKRSIILISVNHVNIPTKITDFVFCFINCAYVISGNTWAVETKVVRSSRVINVTKFPMLLTNQAVEFSSASLAL